MNRVQSTAKGITVNIEVSPNSSKFQITGYNQWRQTLEVKIKAPPSKGKANKEIMKEFSKLTGYETEIVSGHKSRRKTLRINGITEQSFVNILKKLKIDL
ncbi:MAG: YggU family protein [Methanobacteriaceae archaeon]|nr:YggU family protein [Methanobacteriaceae archaeon]